MSQAAAGPAQLVTGEAVAIDLRVARLGSRMVCGLIDLAIQGCALGGLLVVAFLGVQPEDEALATALFLIVYVGILLGYPVACETFLRGRTLGKMALGLRVVRDDGGPIRFRHALTRGLIGVVCERPGLLLGLPAIICMVVSSRSKRLGDVFAGTVVLQVKVPRVAGAPPTIPPQLAGWAALLDLAGVDDGLALRARGFLARTHQLSDESRERLGTELVREITAVVVPPPPPGTPGWAVLSAVLGERTRRAYLRLTSVQRAAQGPDPVRAAPAVPQPVWQPVGSGGGPRG
ncbi:RDD family protein [Parafrankia elaeagni]|uniref:RDD family protein n=1 Tax=Parafrankia elaeagni TaxID=222534 RepID=UPI00036C341B|nr:RDD family protein [Parafrankia elaeagni]